MTSRLALLPLLACAGLAACSNLPPGTAPTAEQIARLPVVTLGHPLPPDDRSYVLYVPAGTPLPIRTEVSGSAFSQGGASTLHVVLRHGIYGYRQYASLDGRQWMPWNQLLDTRLQLQIPGKNGIDAALLDLRVDLR
jgi:hypothetical protein